MTALPEITPDSYDQVFRALHAGPCGTFAGTGLPTGSAHAAMSVDALPVAPDRDAALREVHRVLVPGSGWITPHELRDALVFLARR